MPDSWETMETRAGSHRRPHRHRGKPKGCRNTAAAALAILAATIAGGLLGMVMFTALIALL